MDVDDGVEPDYRFTLANERTFLAWMRTALGLLAGGVAVRLLVEPFEVSAGRTLLALLAIGASGIVAVFGFLRWREIQSAMRLHAPLPRTQLVPIVAFGMLTVSIVAFVLVALE